MDTEKINNLDYKFFIPRTAAYVIRHIAETKSIDIDKATHLFLSSKTYKQMENEKTGYYLKGPVELYNLYIQE